MMKASDNLFQYISQSAENVSDSPNGSVQAAIARTLTRSMALFFARPVRLFRPAKVNGWQTLKHLAKQQGTTLSYQFLISLLKIQGISVIPKHFVPPVIVNATLGAVLWGAYGEATENLHPFLEMYSLANSAISGAIAGACQALVAAPAENVRILLEHGFGGQSWSCAWKAVFRDKAFYCNTTVSPSKQDIRQLRGWLQEVSQMAGRGWNGWRWGLGKDAFGFAVFFSLFELTRRAGAAVKRTSFDLFYKHNEQPLRNQIQKQGPAILYGVTLVTGGVISGLSYEYVCRPWDIARRTITIERIAMPHLRDSPFKIIWKKAMEEGYSSFFQAPYSPTNRKVNWSARLLRTAGRVGPWGAGFLVWEAYGPGLS